MSLLWPGFLLLLGLVPLLVAAYVWVVRRRRRAAVRYSSLALIREALPGQSRLRRHLPFALFALAVTSLVTALARPVAVVSVPVDQATVMLAMDVSRSMCSTDIAPNRLETAKDAALSFIAGQETGTRIGLVAFAGYAELIQVPTADQEILEDAVRSLITGRRTAVGSAILEALAALAALDPSMAPVPTAVWEASPTPQPNPVPRGTYEPAIIVLLTDGASNQGPFPLEAAEQAADRGVRVYTIGYGTAQGGPMQCGDGFAGDFNGGGGMYGDSPYGGGSGGGGGGGGFRRGIDEDTLKAIAGLTGGQYYAAESADELHDVFRSLPATLITREETAEISVAFTALGAVLAALALALAALWHPLP